MQSTLTQNSLRGRATGSIFFAGFGAAWILLALFARENFHVATVAPVLLGLALLLAAAAALIRESKRWPSTPGDPRIGPVFGWVNAIQWIGAGIVAYTLGRLHLEAYTPAAVTCIVGLHLFPLAWLFKYPQHHVTGAVLVVWAAVCACFVPVDHLQSITGIGTGILLWTSATITLAASMRLARRAAHAMQSRLTSPRQGSTAHAS